MVVNKGERLVILGQSGSGKTTILRLIAGLEKPDSGEIAIDGEIVSTNRTIIPPNKRNIGMVFQDYALWPHMTVGQNVDFAINSSKIAKSERQTRVLEILKIVKMNSRISSYPNELSGGEQQRVAIARALVGQPKLLLMDEPLSNLDANLREEMAREICAIQSHFNVTTVYVTHYQDDAMFIADRIAIINNGKLEQIDAPETVYNRPKTQFVAGFIGYMNFFQGKITSKGIFESEICKIACEGADNIEFATLAIRPEMIQFTDDGQVRGTITERIFKGDRSVYKISVKEKTIIVCANEVLSIGNEVGLRFVGQPIILAK
jgi:iron(III) transport system ATP-binding protein